MKSGICLVFVTVLFLALISALLGSRQHRTEFVCEGDLLNISCPSNQLIHFVRANYGRFSRHICAGIDSLNWSVQCLSPRTLRDLQHGCGVTRHCVLPVTSGRFGDFCVDTPKYLEVHFFCVSELAVTSTTRRPTPPWFSPVLKRRVRPSFLAAQSPPRTVSSTEKVMTPVTSSEHSSVPVTDAAPPLHLPLSADFSDDGHIIDVTLPSRQFTSDITEVSTGATSKRSFLQPKVSAHRDYFDVPSGSDMAAPREPSIDTSDLSSANDRCVAAEAHGLWWNSTSAGSWARLSCPAPSVGVAVRFCHGRLGWLRPDLSKCRSMQLMQLQQQLLQDEDAVLVASRLTSLLSQSENTNNPADFSRTHTTSVSTLSTEYGPRYHGGDISLLLRIINQLCSHLSRQLVVAAANTQTRAASVKLVTAAAWTTLHWMLDASSQRRKAMWRELHTPSAPILVHHTLSELLIVHEQVAFLAADHTHVPRLTSYPHHVDSTLAVSVVRLNMAELDRFIELTPDGASVDRLPRRNTIRLTRTALSEHAQNSSITLVVSTLPSIGRLLKLGGAVAHTVISDVVSVSLGVGRRVALSQPVRLTMQLDTGPARNEEAVCVYWDLASSSWSRDGCRRLLRHRSSGDHISTPTNGIQCECDHLTSFAVVYKPIAERNIELNPNLRPEASTDIPLVCSTDEYQVSYRVWVYLCGCGSVLLLLPVLVCGSRLKASRRHTRRHIAFCLILSHIGTMIGAAVGPGSSHSPLLCTLSAVQLHLWQLSAVMWQLCEAVQLYTLVTTAVGLTERRKFHFWPFSYGVPLLIVALCGSLNIQAYGTDKHCWLSTEQYFVFSFVTPASIAIASSLCLYALSYYIWRQSRTGAPLNAASSPSHKQSRLTSVGCCLRHGVSLLLLTTATWCQFLILQERPSSTLQTTYLLSSLAVAVCVLMQQRCVPTLCLLNIHRQRKEQKLHSPSASCRTLNTVVNSANCRTLRRSDGTVNSSSVTPPGSSNTEVISTESGSTVPVNVSGSDGQKSGGCVRDDVLHISQVNAGSQCDKTTDKERYVCNTALSPGAAMSAHDGSQYVNAAPINNLYGSVAPPGGSLSADYVPPYYLTVAANGGMMTAPVSHYSSTYGTSAGVVPAPVPRCGTRVYSSRRPCRQPVVYEEMRRVWHAPNPVVAGVDGDLYWRPGRISNC